MLLCDGRRSAAAARPRDDSGNGMHLGGNPLEQSAEQSANILMEDENAIDSFLIRMALARAA
jgi:hypothetical protein